MGLLTDIYNTVAKFFRQQDEVEGDASKSVATNRLKLVLMQDRTNLTPKILEQMRGEMIDLLSKYLEMDKDLLELNFEQEGDQVALMLSIPVIRAKDEDEIEEAIKVSKAKQEESEDNEEVEANDDETEATFEAEEGDIEEDSASSDEVDESENQEDVLSKETEKNSTVDQNDEDDIVIPKRKRTKKVASNEIKSENNQETDVVAESSET